MFFRNLFAILFILLGIFLACYLGIWWGFIGGIVMLVEEFKRENIDSMIVGLAIARIMFSQLLFAVGFIPAWFGAYILR